jgi:excisionase family DNA binding protein
MIKPETLSQLNLLTELHVKRIREVMRRSLSDIAPVLTVRELSDYLRVHPSTIYRLLRARQLPAFKVGSDWRFNVEEIDRWRVEREKRPVI